MTPGPLAPARELLGEMLLQMEKPAEALQAFEATLKKEPNRFRALSGAIRAATLAGQGDRAREHAQTLLKSAPRPTRRRGRSWPRRRSWCRAPSR